MGNYGTPPITLVRGLGSRVWDDAGNEYLDLVAGIAVCAVGHAHPKVVKAVATQLATLGHVSNLYLTTPAVTLAERLVDLAGVPGRVFFANSGAEANEAALKLARKATGRAAFVSAEGSFHGRTMGALAVTGQPAKRAPFEPLPGPVTFVPYGDVAALRTAVTTETAALILEPIQGENGVVPPPPGYLAAARAACDATGALLVLDEVQTGVGRTGTWFAWQASGVRPDVMTLAKGLGGGLPVGACVGFGDAGDALVAGDHGSTFGGNPVVCAAALAVLDVIETDGLLDAAKTLGERLAANAAPHVAAVRGAGLLRALVLAEPVAKAAEAAARAEGFLVNAIGDGVLRLVPPLVVDAADLDAFTAALPGILSAASAG
ncbi:MAG: acetylornithine/N-succinyldiaminopimelate aminotransferase [Frankiaceae bacterium]|jgi:acetylornithine aminotransferase|nr:acetylornithine/N-succinyldiaminopimelate aminotransferase [Frankiaceae bacterium]